MVLKCIFSDNHLAFCQVKYLEAITCLPQVWGGPLINIVPVTVSAFYAPCLSLTSHQWHWPVCPPPAEFPEVRWWRCPEEAAPVVRGAWVEVSLAAAWGWSDPGPQAWQWSAWSPLRCRLDTCHNTSGSCSASCSPGWSSRCRWWSACSRTRFCTSSTRTSSPVSSSSCSLGERQRRRWSRRQRPGQRREGPMGRWGNLGHWKSLQYCFCPANKAGAGGSSCPAASHFFPDTGFAKHSCIPENDREKMSQSTHSLATPHLSLVFLALVLVGGLAVLLLGALLLALVPVAAAAPPEPELGALLAPLQAVPRAPAPPPHLRQGPHHHQGEEQQPEIFLRKIKCMIYQVFIRKRPYYMYIFVHALSKSIWNY